jgi:hypothetical protein
MFDHRLSLFVLLAWLLMKSFAPALPEPSRLPDPPVNPATGVQPIEIEPERSR